MAIPLLDYSPTSQNQRVKLYAASRTTQDRIYSSDDLLSMSDMDNLIEAAYRQIFFHAFAVDREPALESQLRYGQITVRDFIRGLLLSKTFINSFYNLNNNYRFVEQCIQRVLGRDVYSEREKIAWSAVVMTKGVKGFIDELINSSEYLDSFGETVVPYQRRRVIPGRAEGETPFNIKSPRYDAYHRAKLGFPQSIWQTSVHSFRPQEQKPRAGDPSLFRSMAQKIQAKGNQPPKVSTENIDFLKAVPYRQR
jgi:phycobilisome rod-core linker protein